MAQGDTPITVTGNLVADPEPRVSQAGNFLRSFLHLGFNTDGQGRRVFDGLNPQIAARHTPLNFRFAVPGGAAGLFH